MTVIFRSPVATINDRPTEALFVRGTKSICPRLQVERKKLPVSWYEMLLFLDTHVGD